MSKDIVKVTVEIDSGGHALVNGKPQHGHPINLTDNVIDDVCELIGHGNYLDVAFAANGLNSHSLSKWRRMAERVQSLYPDLELSEWPQGMMPADITVAEWQAFKLITQMRVSEAKAEAFAVLTVKKHMPDQWTAAMTFLERRFPGRWRKRQTIETTDGNNGGLDEDAILDDPESVRLMHDALQRVSGGEIIDSTAEDLRPNGSKRELAAEN